MKSVLNLYQSQSFRKKKNENRLYFWEIITSYFIYCRFWKFNHAAYFKIFPLLKVRLEEELEYKQKENYKLENKVKAMSDELMKGNEIIKKLQGEIKNYHAKVG